MFPIETWNHYEAGAEGHCKNYKRSLKLAIWSASAFSVPPSSIVSFCTGDRKKIFKCNVRHFYNELLAHNLLSQSDTGTKSARAKHS